MINYYYYICMDLGFLIKCECVFEGFLMCIMIINHYSSDVSFHVSLPKKVSRKMVSGYQYFLK